jgi:hypothetical protein
MDDRPHHLGTDELRVRLDAIERDIDAENYRPGPWDRLIADIRSEPDSTRSALAEDISRVSRKLHLRSGRRTIPLASAIAIELGAFYGSGTALVIAE